MKESECLNYNEHILNWDILSSNKDEHVEDIVYHEEHHFLDSLHREVLLICRIDVVSDGREEESNHLNYKYEE
jgi:hypothetical protein